MITSGAQLHLAWMWSSTMRTMSDDDLRGHVRWGDVATTRAIGAVVERRLVASRADGLMPIVIDVAAMPMRDGDEIVAFRACMDHLARWMEDPGGCTIAAARSLDHARAAAVVIAGEMPGSPAVWAQGPTRGSALHGAALDGILWREFGLETWPDARHPEPIHEVVGIRNAGSAHLRIHPLACRMYHDEVTTLGSNPIAVLRAHALLRGEAA